MRIDLTRTNVNTSRQNPRTYVSATARAGDGVYNNVGIHLKGAGGTVRPIGHEKPAFALRRRRIAQKQGARNSSELLIGDTQWQSLTYEFRLDEEEQVELLCELRAEKGRVWFDVRSLKLHKR